MARPARKRPAPQKRKGSEPKISSPKRRDGRAAPRPDWLNAVAKDPAYSWAIKAWDKAAAAKGSWFDAEKADRVVALWPMVFRLTTLRFAGKAFQLRPWQEIIVRLLVGWKIPIEVIDPDSGKPTIVWVRLFRVLRLWIPRKGGKTEFLAALALLFWALEGVVGGEGYCFARDEVQAQLPFNRMKAMVANCPELLADIQLNKRSLYLKPCAAPFELLTGAEEGKHGKLPVVILGDEMHEWRSRKIENDLHQGTGAHIEPIELYGSTAGLKTNLTGVELWDESLAILEGRIDDPTTLVALFAANDDDDWEDEKVWSRVNPSLGLSPTLQYLQREAALAKGNPRKTAEFKCYHLNLWVAPVTRWLPLKKWDACSRGKTGWKKFAEELKGRPCFGACDVSATQDFTALVWLFPPETDGERWKLVIRFWIPEETLAERVRKAPNLGLEKWIAAGALETTPGDYVDQGFVQKAIAEGFEDYDVQGFGFDPWNARKLMADLQKDGVDPELIVEVRQGILSLGEPSKVLERMIFGAELDHGGHPVLRWMAGNTAIRFDENLNFMPAKKRSSEKIDGIVATVTAIAVSMASGEDEESPYADGRDLRMM